MVSVNIPIVSSRAGGIVRTVLRAVDLVSEGCRLVRAYNELSRLDPSLFRDNDWLPQEIDRALGGHRPRRRPRHR